MLAIDNLKVKTTLFEKMMRASTMLTRKLTILTRTALTTTYVDEANNSSGRYNVLCNFIGLYINYIVSSPSMRKYSCRSVMPGMEASGPSPSSQQESSSSTIV